MVGKVSTRTFRLFLALFFIFCTIFLLSCKQKWDYTKELVQLDSTSTRLIAAERNLLGADTGYFRVSYNSTAQYLRSIKEMCFNDTLQKNTAIFLSDAYTYSANVYCLLDSNKSIEKIISASKERISDLKHDLAHSLIEKNNAKEYIEYEQKAVQEITESIIRTIEKANVSCEKLDLLKTQIIFMADSLQAALNEKSKK